MKITVRFITLLTSFLASFAVSCSATTSANETLHASPSSHPTDVEAVEPLSTPSPSPSPAPRMSTSASQSGTVSPTSTPTSLPSSTASLEPLDASPTPSPLPLPDATQTQEVNLIDPRYELAVAGDEQYQHERIAAADFDNDGQIEKAYFIANAFVVDGETAWDDGHVWQLYIEEPTGKRTHVFVQFLQLTHAEAIVAKDKPDQGPTIVLLTYSPFHLTVYEIIYNGPDNVITTKLLDKNSHNSGVMFMPPAPSE